MFCKNINTYSLNIFSFSHIITTYFMYCIRSFSITDQHKVVHIY